MNERIEKLAEQATSIVESPKNAYGWGSSYAYFDKEKFAELIVRECAEKCVYVVDRQEILVHFGVEE